MFFTKITDKFLKTLCYTFNKYYITFYICTYKTTYCNFPSFQTPFKNLKGGDMCSITVFMNGPILMNVPIFMDSPKTLKLHGWINNFSSSLIGMSTFAFFYYA